MISPGSPKKGHHLSSITQKISFEAIQRKLKVNLWNLKNLIVEFHVENSMIP